MYPWNDIIPTEGRRPREVYHPNSKNPSDAYAPYVSLVLLRGSDLSVSESFHSSAMPEKRCISELQRTREVDRQRARRLSLLQATDPDGVASESTPCARATDLIYSSTRSAVMGAMVRRGPQ